jgi:hypothetical protein
MSLSRRDGWIGIKANLVKNFCFFYPEGRLILKMVKYLLLCIIFNVQKNCQIVFKVVILVFEFRKAKST